MRVHTAHSSAVSHSQIAQTYPYSTCAHRLHPYSYRCSPPHILTHFPNTHQHSHTPQGHPTPPGTHICKLLHMLPHHCLPPWPHSLLPCSAVMNHSSSEPSQSLQCYDVTLLWLTLVLSKGIWWQSLGWRLVPKPWVEEGIGMDREAGQEAAEHSLRP